MKTSEIARMARERVEVRINNKLRKQMGRQTKPDDIIDLSITALDGYKLLAVLGQCRGSIYDHVQDKLGASDEFSQMISEEESKDWQPHSKLTKAALDQFKSSKKDSIEQFQTSSMMLLLNFID